MGSLLQQLALLGALMLSGEQGLGHGVPCCSAAWGAWALWVPSVGLVGDDGGRVETGHQGPQGCLLGITWQSLLTACPLCFFPGCASKSHVPTWAMCCQCTVSFCPCVPVSVCAESITMCPCTLWVCVHESMCVLCVQPLWAQFHHVCIQMSRVCVPLCAGFVSVCPSVSVPMSLSITMCDRVLPRVRHSCTSMSVLPCSTDMQCPGLFLSPLFLHHPAPAEHC